MTREHIQRATNPHRAQSVRRFADAVYAFALAPRANLFRSRIDLRMLPSLEGSG